MIVYVILALCFVGSLAAAGAIIARKLPLLTLIDTGSLPKERDAKKKKELIKSRVSRSVTSWGGRMAARMAARSDAVRERFRGQYRKLLAIDRQMRRESAIPADRVPAAVASLIAEAEALREKEEFVPAEKKYIEAISLDQKSAGAYRGLADLYVEIKRYDQARQTFAFLARMLAKAAGCRHGQKDAAECRAEAADHEDIAAQLEKLAEAHRQAGDLAAAREAFERASAILPANPRLLDFLLDVCILGGDKERAREVLAQLREANPENAKLASLEEKVAAMPEPPAKAESDRRAKAGRRR
jgi:tetratricopeptide (TPR) repeat protein